MNYLVDRFDLSMINVHRFLLPTFLYFPLPVLTYIHVLIL